MARWRRKKISQIQRPLILDCIFADEIVYNAYKAGSIGWNIYNLAQDRIKRTRNGTWMFENSDKNKIDEIYINSLQKKRIRKTGKKCQ